MTCSSCKYLKENSKCAGALCGAKYYCSKMKIYVDGSSDRCNMYDKKYSRSNYECSNIYDDGKSFCDDDRSILYHVFILVIIIVIGLLIKVINSISL